MNPHCMHTRKETRNSLFEIKKMQRCCVLSFYYRVPGPCQSSHKATLSICSTNIISYVANRYKKYMIKRRFHHLSSAAVLLVLTLFQYSSSSETTTAQTQTAHHQMQTEHEPSPEGRQHRNMVGGYADADIAEERVVDAAKFAVSALADKQQLEQEGGDDGDRTYTFDVAAAIRADEVNVIVLEAQKQVVAGMNYRMTIGLTDKTSGECLGGFKCVVYDRFGDMKVSIWGKEVECGEIGIIRAEAKRQDEEGDEEG